MGSEQLSMNDIFADLPATHLPSGWIWRRNIDGTGYLLSPYGRSLFPYDLKPSRYGEGICFIDSENDDRDAKYFGSFDDFRLFIEQRTRAWIAKNKEIEFIEISPEQVSKIMDNYWGSIRSPPDRCFFVRGNEKYVGIDTSSGFVWTEEFSDIESCVVWLQQKHDIHDRLEKLANRSVDFDSTV